jgi:hypothetical protein
MSAILACKRDPWGPHVLTRSVLKAWWNADDHGTARMTDDGAGLISNWVDRIGGMAVTATTTARPTWAASSFNSTVAGLTFDGVANCFVSTTLTTLPTGAVAGEIWVSTVLNTAGSLVNIFDYGGAVASSARVLQASSGAGKARVSDLTTIGADTSANVLTTPSVVSGQFFGTTMNGWINGNAFTVNPVTISSLNTGTTRARIGASNLGAAAGFWPGVIRHVFVLQGTLSDVDRQKFEGFLAWDGGYQASLPATHPYQRFRP